MIVIWPLIILTLSKPQIKTERIIPAQFPFLSNSMNCHQKCLTRVKKNSFPWRLVSFPSAPISSYFVLLISSANVFFLLFFCFSWSVSSKKKKKKIGCLISPFFFTFHVFVFFFCSEKINDFLISCSISLISSDNLLFSFLFIFILACFVKKNVRLICLFFFFSLYGSFFLVKVEWLLLNLMFHLVDFFRQSLLFLFCFFICVVLKLWSFLTLFHVFFYLSFLPILFHLLEKQEIFLSLMFSSF